MANIGYATMTVIPSLRGMEKVIGEQLGNATKPATPTGESIGAKLGGGIRKTLGAGVKVIGAAAGSVLSAALWKGFQRLSNIETAERKMVGLGHSAEVVARLMDRKTGPVIESVRGTAFGLGEAALTASGALAAMVSEAEMPSYLKAVAQSAAAAGIGMDHMGSIFNKVRSRGKAQNDVLGQIADRGIPIYEKLAEQLGVTTDEVFKMATASKIGFKEFEEAMASAGGTVADELGKTFPGAMDNLGAALGRLGEGLLGPIYEQLPGAIGGITALLDSLGPVAVRVGQWLGAALSGAIEKVTALADILITGNFSEAFSKAFNVEEDSGLVRFLLRVRDTFIGVYNLIVNGDFTAAFGRAFNVSEDSALVDFLLRARDAITELFDKIKGGGLSEFFKGFDGSALAGLGAIITGVAAKMGKLLPFGKSFATSLFPVLAKVGPAFKFLTGPIGIAVALFAAAYGSSQEFREAVHQLLAVVGDLVGQVAAALLPVFVQLVESVLPVAVGIFQTLVPVVAAVVSAFADVLAWLTPIITAIAPFVAGFMGITKVVGVVIGIFTKLKVVFGAIKVLMMANPFGAIVIGVIALIVAIKALWENSETFRNIVTAAWEGIKAAAMAVVDWFTGSVVPWLQGAWDTIKQGAQDLWTAITDAWNGIKEAFTSAWEAISEFATAAWETLSQFASNVFEWGLQILEWITLPTRMAMALVIAVFAWLIEKAWPYVQQFGQWVADGFMGIYNAISDWLGQAWDFISGIWTTVSEFIGGVVSAIVERQIQGWTKIYNGIKGALDKVWAVISDIWNKVSGFIGTVLSAIWGVISSIWNQISGFLSTVMGTIWGTIKSAWDRISSTISTIAGNIWSYVSSGFNKVVSTITGFGSKMWNAAKKVFDRVIDAAKSIIQRIKNIGSDIVTGLINGITGAGGRLWSAITGFIDRNVPGPVKKLLGISSPSRLFQYFGEMSGEGLERGILGMRGDVASASRRLAESLTDAFAPELSLDDIGAATMQRPRVLPVPPTSPVMNAEREAERATSPQVNLHVYNPIGEPTEVTVNRQMQRLAALGVV